MYCCSMSHMAHCTAEQIQFQGAVLLVAQLFVHQAANKKFTICYLTLAKKITYRQMLPVTSGADSLFQPRWDCTRARGLF